MNAKRHRRGSNFIVVDRLSSEDPISRRTISDGLADLNPELEVQLNFPEIIQKRSWDF